MFLLIYIMKDLMKDIKIIKQLLFLTFLGQDLDVLQTVFWRSGLLQGVVDLPWRRQGGNGQEDEDPERNSEDFGNKLVLNIG